MKARVRKRPDGWAVYFPTGLPHNGPATDHVLAARHLTFPAALALATRWADRQRTATRWTDLQRHALQEVCS